MSILVFIISFSVHKFYGALCLKTWQIYNMVDTTAHAWFRSLAGTSLLKIFLELCKKKYGEVIGQFAMLTETISFENDSSLRLRWALSQTESKCVKNGKLLILPGPSPSKKMVCRPDGLNLSCPSVDSAMYWITPYPADQLQPSCKTNWNILCIAENKLPWSSRMASLLPHIILEI